MDVGSETFDTVKDPVTIHQLFHAVDELSIRGLVQSASWLSQIIAATPADPSGIADVERESPGQSDVPDLACETRCLSPGASRKRSKSYVVAKGFFDCREYRRAAQALAEARLPHSVFLRLYATYLSGEKRRDEERQELADWTEPANMELDSLRDELAKLRKEGRLDAHLWYLAGVVLKRLKLSNEAVEAFEHCLSLFPWNWGAWLELAPLCTSREMLSALKIKDHWMKSMFEAHFLNEIDEPEEAVQIYEGFYEVAPTCTFIRCQLALALYNVRRFDEAQQLYDETYADDPSCLEGADIYSNILYVREDKVQLSLLANRCMKIDKFRLETCCVIGNYYSLRGQHEQAVAYFQRALKLNRNYLSAWTLMGHEFLEMKNTAAAVEAYRRAVDINPKDFRAWYGLGQTYELLNMPLYTLYYYQKAAALRPKDVRMWCAIGQTFEELSRQDDAIRCYERARGCDDQDSIALSKLAYLYERMARDALKDGRQQELGAEYAERAAQYHMSNLQRREEEKLGGAETTEALKFLAEHFYAKREFREAEKYCYRLMTYSGQEKDFSKKLLRQIHSEESKE